MSEILMHKVAFALAAVLSMCGLPAGADEFQSVRCGADIPKAMIGKRTSNDPVAATEKKHGDIGLKDLGADEISGKLSSINWLICGSEFISLVDRAGVVRDALAFPTHSKRSPAFSGRCRRKGKETPDVIVAILDGGSTADSFPARIAWRIDERRAKFVKVAVDDLVCPGSGIYTVDGGL
jgi:hypothetical protein